MNGRSRDEETRESYGERTWETWLKEDKDRYKEDRDMVRDTKIEDRYTERYIERYIGRH